MDIRKIKGVPVRVVRRVNIFLLHQTSRGDDFLVFKLPESHFRRFSSQNSSFERFLGITLSKEWRKYFVLRIGLWSNKFLRDSLSPKLSKKVRGIIENRVSTFFIIQTCGCCDFFMMLKDFYSTHNLLCTAFLRHFLTKFNVFACVLPKISCKHLRDKPRALIWCSHTLWLSLNARACS